jgi:hypothetical protein
LNFGTLSFGLIPQTGAAPNAKDKAKEKHNDLAFLSNAQSALEPDA